MQQQGLHTSKVLFFNYVPSDAKTFMTRRPYKYEIVDCGAFCEVIFFCISPKNLLGDFFYSLNARIQPRGPQACDG
jgi:hypothetical protein